MAAKTAIMIMSTIMLFTTGGTIASVEKDGGAVRRPQLSGGELLKLLPQSAPNSHDVEVMELGRLPSTEITPAVAFAWTREVRRQLLRDDVTGAVVTIGTSAMEECCYLFDLTLRLTKPVVFTGAMRMPAQLSSDAGRNLVSSLFAVRDRRLADMGVVVLMNDEIHAARDVLKMHSYGVHGFQSPESGVLGRIIEGPGAQERHISLERHMINHEHIPATGIETRVGYIKAVLGCDGMLINALVNAGAKGIVIEAFGEGSATTGMAASIERALNTGLPIVIASRSLCGGTAPLYTEVGESRWLLDRGALFAGRLSGPKARIKLMLALGLDDPKLVRAAFEMS
jgi:L-asparaginase